jgi:hypothetical protein
VKLFNNLPPNILKHHHDVIAFKSELKKQSSVFQATTEPQIVRKTSRRQVECWPDFSMILFLAYRHIRYLSNYVSFTALVEVGAEHCEET